MRECVIKEQRVWGVVDKVRRIGGDESIIRRAPQEVGKGCYSGGAANMKRVHPVEAEKAEKNGLEFENVSHFKFVWHAVQVAAAGAI